MPDNHVDQARAEVQRIERALFRTDRGSALREKLKGELLQARQALEAAKFVAAAYATCLAEPPAEEHEEKNNV
jgi:hypothetical protein